MTRGLRMAVGLGVIALSAGFAFERPHAATPSNPASHNIVAIRRLTEAEYRRSIADIFGPEIKIKGRFEPEVRRDGLIAIGSSQASISSSGMEQYYAMASGISEQVTGEHLRKTFVACTPASVQKPDDACAGQFFTKYGRLLYRRPLDDKELKGLVKTSHDVTTQSKDFYAGLQETLTTVLTSPSYLFRVERAGGAAKDGMIPLDDYSRASRLSFMLWDAPPDDALLAAADHGQLSTPDGLKAQVDRLSASPRLADGMSAFFDDMLQFVLFRTQTKDAAAFPKYSQVIAEQARQQTLRTMIDLLVTKNGDYRDIFTTRDTFMTRGLALVYKVPYTSSKDWSPYTFTTDSGRSGVLTQISFLSLFAHPAESSPTKRGVALNEIFLCQPIPPPPGNVDFSAINDTSPTRLRTLRLRLAQHANNPTCAGCHTIVDPLGVSLEKFDALGQFRTMDDGELIDDSSQIGGKTFAGAQGLGLILHDLYSAGAGRAVTSTADRKTVDGLTKSFGAGDYRIPSFLKTMAASEDFYTAPQPSKTPAPPVKVASATPNPSLETK
jgi:hypothetical protein